MSVAPWLVIVSIEHAHIDALRDALPLVHPPERYGLVTEVRADGTDGDTDLQISIDADSAEAAIEDAVGVYQRARAQAGLPPDETTVVGWVTPLGPGRARARARWEELLDDARGLLEQGRPDLAIIRAQSASETLTSVVLRSVVGEQIGSQLAEPIAAMFRSSLSDSRTQRLIAAFTSRRASDEDWWPGYRTHLGRRNAILHEGAQVDAAWAAESIAAVEACCEWLQRL